MIKKVFNIFILLVFAMQILPIKEVGCLLFGNKITEDVVQDINDNAQDGFKIDIKSEFIVPSSTGLIPIYTEQFFMLKEFSIVFPHNHSTDIYSPPPNC